MSDELTPPVAPEYPSVEPAAPVAPTSPFNADGSFVENWQTLAPEGYEELRDDKTIPRFKNVWELSRGHVNVRKQVPMDKMPRPNDNFSEADWNEFYNAGGRPDTPGDYNIQRPEEIPEEVLPKEMLAGFQDLFHKIGLSKKQSDALVGYNNEQIIQQTKDGKRIQEEFDNKLQDQLTNEWGRAYAQKEFRCNKAVERGTEGDEGHYERVSELVNNNVDLKKCFANLEDNFSEHNPVESSTISTPKDLQTLITEIEQDPRYLSTDKNVRMPLVNQVMRLREQMVKDKQPG